MISGCNFIRNQAKSGSAALTLLFTDLYIENTEFNGNIATSKTDNIFAVYSNITLVGSRFLAYHNNGLDPEKSSDLRDKKGSFIFAGS